MFPVRDNIPTASFPVVTTALLVTNVLAYFFFQHGTLSLGDPSSQAYLTNLIDYGAIPYELTHPGDNCEFVNNFQDIACEGQRGVAGRAAPQPPTWITPFTAMFMHGGLLHLGGNMLFLWIFGNNVEDAMGPVRFIGFYLLAGLMALALQVVVSPQAAVPTIGASGAIAGVLGGYLVLFPRARIITVVFIIFFFTILELPAVLILALWFLQQVLFGYLDLAQPSGDAGGVAYFAHVGGFVFGGFAVKLLADERRRQRQLELPAPGPWRRRRPRA
jgi:membrane associated rhomboid family serine protease